MVLPFNIAGSETIPRNGVEEVSVSMPSTPVGNPNNSLAKELALEILMLDVSPVVLEEILNVPFVSSKVTLTP